MKLGHLSTTDLSKNLHILIITPGFPKDESDSTCIPALQDFLMAISSNHKHIRFTVLSMQYPVSSSYNWNGIKVISVSGNNRKGLKKYKTWIKTKRLAADLIRSQNIDLIHAFWAREAAYIAHKVSIKTKTPYLVTAMGQDVLSTPAYMASLELENLVYVSQFQKQQSILNAKKTKVIEWGVESINREVTRNIDIVGVGSLLDVKDWKRFISIASILKSIRPNLNIHLIGDGPLRADLEKLNDSFGAPVKLRGELSRELTLKSIASTRIVLHTARYESFCLVLAEGLAAGCNVISSNVGIAYSNELIEVYKTDDDAVNLITKALDTKRDEVLTFPQAEECAAQYSELYFSLVQ